KAVLPWRAALPQGRRLLRPVCPPVRAAPFADGPGAARRGDSAVPALETTQLTAEPWSRQPATMVGVMFRYTGSSDVPAGRTPAVNGQFGVGRRGSVPPGGRGLRENPFLPAG